MLRHGMVQLEFKLHESHVVWSRSNFLLSMLLIFFCWHFFIFLLFIIIHFCFPFFYTLSILTLCNLFLCFILTFFSSFFPLHPSYFLRSFLTFSVHWFSLCFLHFFSSSFYLSYFPLNTRRNICTGISEGLLVVGVTISYAVNVNLIQKQWLLLS
jgi:hypothetical protein